MHAQHPSAPIEKSDVEPMAHRDRVHVAAAREHERRGIGSAPRQAPQTHEGTRRHDPRPPERSLRAILQAEDSPAGT